MYLWRNYQLRNQVFIQARKKGKTFRTGHPSGGRRGGSSTESTRSTDAESGSVVAIVPRAVSAPAYCECRCHKFGVATATLRRAGNDGSIEVVDDGFAVPAVEGRGVDVPTPHDPEGATDVPVMSTGARAMIADELDWWHAGVVTGWWTATPTHPPIANSALTAAVRTTVGRGARRAGASGFGPGPNGRKTGEGKVVKVMPLSVAIRSRNVTIRSHRSFWSGFVRTASADGLRDRARPTPSHAPSPRTPHRRPDASLAVDPSSEPPSREPVRAGGGTPRWCDT
jgi:hypothetical protein